MIKKIKKIRVIRQITVQTIMKEQITMTEIKDCQGIDSDITGRIIGCAMKVHSALGNGFQEVI